MTFDMDSVMEGLTYEETVGVLMNLGVMAALMLSFVVAVQTMYGPGDTDQLDFREMMWQAGDTAIGPEFREFVIHTMVGEGFNMTIELEPGYSFDAAAVLRNTVEETSGFGNGFFVHDDMEMAIEAIIYDFPMNKLRMFLIRHKDEATGILHLSSNYINLCTISLVIFFSILLVSFLQYVSLSISHAGDDTPAARKCLMEWNKFGVPISCVNFFLFSIALTCFITSIGQVTYLQSSHIRNAGFLYMNWMLAFLVPYVSVFGVLVAMYLKWKLDREAPGEAQVSAEQVESTPIEPIKAGGVF